MIRLAICGLCKIDGNVLLSDDEFVKVGRTALKRIGKGDDGEIEVEELHAICSESEKMEQYLAMTAAQATRG